MALTKLTKHVVHGSLIVQMIYQDINDMSMNTTGVTQWGQALTLTPQYSDSVLELHFSGIVRCATTYDSDSALHTLYFYVNGQQEYVLANAMTAGRQNNSYNQHGQQFGSHVSMFHRHNPGTTNAQIVDVRMSKHNTTGGTSYCYDGFLTIKEISKGVTTGTGGTHIL
jgi:hypothetical protein